MEKQEHLPTHTWEGRNLDALQKLAEILNAWKAKNLRILNIGPGGISRGYAPYFPRGKESSFGYMARAQKKLVNAVESISRDDPRSELVSFEPLEVWTTLYPLGIESIMFADKFAKVRDAVDRDFPHPHITIGCDIEREPLAYKGQRVRGNVVIILNTLTKCKINRVYALDNAIQSTEDGGYILGTHVPETIPGFTRLAHFGPHSAKYDFRNYSIFFKGNRPDKIKGWERRATPLDERAVVARIEAANKGQTYILK